MTPEEFAYKIDSEGGIYDAFVGYGLNLDDLDPEYIDTPFGAAVADVTRALENAQWDIEQLESLIDEMEVS